MSKFESYPEGQNYYPQYVGRVNRIEDLLVEQDLRNRKICLIEDIFKYALYLYAKGIPGYGIYVEGKWPGKTFDLLYDQSIYNLDQYYTAICRDVAERIIDSKL